MGEGNTITVSLTVQKRALWLLVQSTIETNSVLFCVGPLALTYSYFAPNSSNVLTLTWILVYTHTLCVPSPALTARLTLCWSGDTPVQARKWVAEGHFIAIASAYPKM